MQLAFSSNAYLNYPLEETVARIAALGYRGMELLADVPHAWPAGLLPERRREIRACLDRHGMTISNINGFMMNAVADPRQPYWHPSWIEPDRHYRAIRREHTKRALQLAKDLGGPSIQTEPGGPLEEGQSWQAAAAGLLRRNHALRRIGRKAGGFPAHRARAGTADRAIRAVPGVRRPHRFALGGAEFRYRPCLLRGRGSAGLDRADGPPYQALPPGGHSPVARASPHDSRSGGD